MADGRNELKKIAVLTALASILQVFESFFPHPVPGVRLGLANMVTIVALVRAGFGPALEIAVLRSIISALMLGTLLTPSFILSFSSAMASTLAMGWAYGLIKGKKNAFLSLTGISLAGAIVHVLTQVGIVYIMFIRHEGIFMLMPVLGFSAALTGWVNGLIASGICYKIDFGGAERLHPDHFKAGKMPVASILPCFRKKKYGNMPAEIKILAVTALAVSMVFVESLPFYWAALLLIAVLTFVLKASAGNVLRSVWKMRWFVLFSFLIPSLFGGAGRVLFSAGILSITAEGLMHGALFASRIVILMLASALLVETTAPEKLASGIKNILMPFSFTGLRAGFMGEAVVLAWASIPELWEKTEAFIAGSMGKRAKDRWKVIDKISGFVAALYVKAEKESVKVAGKDE